MAYSINTHNYTGGPQVFPTNFALGVLDESHIEVFVTGEFDSSGEQIYREFMYDPNTGDVHVYGDIPVPSQVVTQRTVPKDELMVSFELGSDVTKRNLDIISKQILMAAHEVLDGRIGDIQGILDLIESQTSAAVASAVAAADSSAQAGVHADAAQVARLAAEAARTGSEAARDAAEAALSEVVVHGSVPANRKINTGNYMTGGGDLSTDRTLNVNFNKIRDDLRPEFGAPIGAVHWFAGGLPAGWIACDGSPVTNLYPDLRQYLLDAGSPFGTSGGHPRSPNLTNGNRFIRAAGGEITLGTYQEDQFQRITGTFAGGRQGQDASGVFTQRSVSSVDTGSGANQQGVTMDTLNDPSLRTGDETRPRNIALRAGIKAYGSFTPNGQADLDEVMQWVENRLTQDSGEAWFDLGSTPIFSVSIPNGMNHIEVLLFEVVGQGNGMFRFQVGSGSIIKSGYDSTGSILALSGMASTRRTTSFVLSGNNNNGRMIQAGKIHLDRMGDTWVYTFTGTAGAVAAGTFNASGSIIIPDQIRQFRFMHSPNDTEDGAAVQLGQALVKWRK